MLAATYDEFERVLRDARALPEPAEAHGTLAGALCSSRDYGLIEWLHEILPDDSPEGRGAAELGAAERLRLHGAYAGRATTPISRRCCPMTKRRWPNAPMH